MENKYKSTEEIDLGQLFKLMGNVFNKVLGSLAALFRFIFKVTISFLIFVQSHFLKLVIAGVVGIIVGFFLDRNSDQTYRSMMTVEPNLGSTRQLYSNIKMYNELVKAADTFELARKFSINPTTAATILKFDVKALISRNGMLSTYNRYLLSLDSTNRNIIDFEAYVNDFDPLDSDTHSIIVDAKNDSVAKLLEEDIISSINNNPYYKLKKETTDLNIEGSKAILESQLKDVDTLKKIYTQVILNQSKSEPNSGGTNISLSNKEINTKEFELLKETRGISKEVQRLNIEKIENKNIINVISTFPDRGVRYKSWSNSYIVLFPLLLIFLVFIILCFLYLNKYLSKYKK